MSNYKFLIPGSEICFCGNQITTAQFGGARRDRTADLNTASVALSQLSYSPAEGARNLREATRFVNWISVA